MCAPVGRCGSADGGVSSGDGAASHPGAGYGGDGGGGGEGGVEYGGGGLSLGGGLGDFGGSVQKHVPRDNSGHADGRVRGVVRWAGLVHSFTCVFRSIRGAPEGGVHT